MGYIASEGKLELRAYSENHELFGDNDKDQIIFNDLKQLLGKVDEYGELQTKGQTEKATELNVEQNGAPRKAWEVLRKLESPIPLTLSDDSVSDTINIEPKPKIRHLPDEKGELIYLENCQIENINYYERDVISFVHFHNGVKKKVKAEVTEEQLRSLSQFALDRKNVNIELIGILRSKKEYRGVLKTLVATAVNDLIEDESLGLFADLDL